MIIGECVIPNMLRHITEMDDNTKHSDTVGRGMEKQENGKQCQKEKKGSAGGDSCNFHFLQNCNFAPATDLRLQMCNVKTETKKSSRN